MACEVQETVIQAGDWEILIGNDEWASFDGIIKSSKSLHRLIIDDNEIWASDDHIFYQGGIAVKVGQLQDIDVVDSINGSISFIKTYEYKIQDSYDMFNVGNGHQYVINDTILTHNCDEFAFVRPSIAKEFWTSISPTLATGGDCIISSTPNGDQDIFSELWRGAESQVNDFKSIYVAWDRPPNRDEVFKRREIGKIGETRWRQEYECLGEDTILTACSPDGQDFNCKLSELLVYSAHI